MKISHFLMTSSEHERKEGDPLIQLNMKKSLQGIYICIVITS